MLTDQLPQQGAYAVADAKYWDRPLDQTIKAKGGDPFTNKNPSYQIAFYIQHTGLDWGILTNGRKWRLYHKATAHKLDRFYEVDLSELLASGEVSRFLYFYAFFSREAFDPHPVGIAATLEESANYARGVGNTLKTQVYDALRHLAQGFLDYAPNELQTDPATLKQIYDASLIVLYRILFIFYAEARELLPIYESADYRTQYSLKSIKEDVARSLDSGTRRLPGSHSIWPRLKDLFEIINAGSPPLHVATFNGGLFDPKKHPFLEKYTVGDAHLQQALDKLARVDHQFVDYRDLAVRHLGTIYEGLLEYHLEPLSTDGIDNIEYLKKGWSLALLNDKGERKATGSYYTPDYIVKYIVEQTLGPVLESNITGLEADSAKVEAVLATNVLDPAMGSGHFLVEATEYIARYLVEMGIHPEGSTSDETDLAHWKRRVVQSCIYGVDLNPLAVELAKLSLWLATVAKDRPLSFLDHHLRAGNSLVGARLADLRLESRPAKSRKKPSKKEQEAVEAGQLSMLSDDAFLQAMSSAVGSMWQIEENPGLTVAQVKEQEQAYSQLREQLTRKYGRLADLVTAQHFGLKVEVTSEQWQALADFATGRTMAVLPQFVKWLEEADTIAEHRRFLHWELEFPEVFFDRFGQPLGVGAGFDAVVGNPPYDVLAEKERNEDLSSLMSFFSQSAGLAPAQGSKIDLFRLMLAKALTLLHSGGLSSFIVPMSLLADQQTVNLRRHILTVHGFVRIDAFPQKDDPSRRVFTEAKLPTCVIVVKSNPDIRQPFTVTTHPGRDFEEVSGTYSCTIADLEKFDTETLSIPLLQSDLALNLVTKLSSTNNPMLRPIGELFRSYQGEINETTMARLLSADAKVGPQVLRGSNVQRYLFVEKAKQGETKYINVPLYEAEIGGEKATHSKLIRFGYQRNAALDSWRRLIFGPLPCPSYCFDSVSYFLVLDENDAYALLALLNSQLLEWRFGLTSTNNHVSTREIANLPARRMTFNTSKERRSAMAVKGHELYRDCLNEQAPEEILGFIRFLLAQEPEEADVVHDLLAFLAQQMLDLNKERQEAVETLVLDLEGILSPAELQKIGRLWTPPKDAPPAETQTMLGALAAQRLELRDDIGKVSEEQWKWLLKGRLKKIVNLADLVRVYRQRQPAIVELDRKIGFTDGLIDQIVYRLYGLTEEEVAIVEGA